MRLFFFFFLISMHDSSLLVFFFFFCKHDVGHMRTSLLVNISRLQRPPEHGQKHLFWKKNRNVEVGGRSLCSSPTSQVGCFLHQEDVQHRWKGRDKPALSSQDQDRRRASVQAGHAKVKPPSVKRPIYKSLEIQGAKRATVLAQPQRQKACICQMLYNYFL